LRPDFLRGTPARTESGMVNVRPSVFLNGSHVGGLEALETIALDAVEEIRFIRTAQAQAFWGSYCPCTGGVIHVRTHVK
jgi:outer membrane cobalamin receptor